MNYKPYPEYFWQKLETTLKNINTTNQQPIAAFDADGTLWDTDLGENFFQYQIDNCQLDLPKDPWNHYLEMKKINNDPRDAYVWLAQINQKQTLAQVRAWAQEAFEALVPKPIFSEQQKLIERLHQANVKIYIVTASVKWAIEPGAAALGIPSEQVIGVETAVEQGVVTNQPILPITYRSGKAEALLKKTNKQLPFLCSGNTIGDLELLQLASDIQLVVSAASRDDKLFKSENELMQKAQELNWFGHRFI